MNVMKNEIAIDPKRRKFFFFGLLEKEENETNVVDYKFH
jgi:hypothetical protein